MTTAPEHPRRPAGLPLDAAAARLAELLADDCVVDGSLEEARRLSQDLAAALPLRLHIERAKGVVMGAKRVGEDDAFDHLRTLSQRTNRPLRLVAAEIAESGQLPD